MKRSWELSEADIELAILEYVKKHDNIHLKDSVKVNFTVSPKYGGYRDEVIGNTIKATVSE